MGLDIFLRKFSEPDIDTSRIYTDEELDELDFSYVDADSVYEVLDEDLIERFTQQVTIQQSYWDENKLFNLFKEKYPEHYASKTPEDLIPSNTMSGSTDEGLVFKFVDYADDNVDYSDRPFIQIQTTHEEVNDYLVKRDNLVYVYETEEIAYQRKGLNDYGWELLPGNCVYSTDKDLVQEMVDEGGLDESFIDNWVDDCTAIYAWW